jgi:hypothetical protein
MMNWLRSFTNSRLEPEEREEPKGRYPETAIVSVASHGLIKLERKTEKKPAYALNDIPKFKVPDATTIIKYSEIPPGTCNMMTDDKLNEYVEYILAQDLESKPVSEAFEIIQDMANTGFRELKKEIVSQQQNLTLVEKNPVSTQFVNTYEHGYLTRMFKHGDIMLNKSYVTETAGRHVVNDWQIVLLNYIGQPDLFQLLAGRTHHDDDRMITLEQIVLHLKENGVKNIILFDFSCSNYADENFEDINEPTQDHGARLLRNSMIDLGLFGGRRRRTKNRKSNKKRRSTKKRSSLIKQKSM